MSKFDGKFRKNMDYQEDNEIASNFVKFRKRGFEDSENRKSKTKQNQNYHNKRQEAYDFLDG